MIVQLKWGKPENSPMEHFPDLVIRHAFTRGGSRVVIFPIEGARTYTILDYTDVHGVHVSRLALSAYMPTGHYLDEEGNEVEEDEGTEVVDSCELAEAHFADLDAAKARAQQWEAREIEYVGGIENENRWGLEDDDQ